MSSESGHRLEWRCLDELVAAGDADNPKAHDLLAIRDSIHRFGFIDPPTAADGSALAVGDGRVAGLALIRDAGAPAPPGVRVSEDGCWLVPVVAGVDLSDEDARAYRLADNRATALGGWDDETLLTLLKELAVEDEGLDGLGFGLADLEALAASLEVLATDEPADLDAVAPTGPTDCPVMTGELWLIGRHRVLCGDVTVPADVNRLLGDVRPALAITDPPYGVDLASSGSAAARNATPIVNDALGREPWEAFCRNWTQTLVERTDGAMYVFMSSKELPTVSRLLQQAGGHWSDTLIWVKDRFVLGRADYHRQYEPLWYGWREGAQRHWLGGRDQGDTWFFDRPTSSPDHPTQKPVALIEQAISNSSVRGSDVWDPFLGSGTTLIAAERTGRRCFGMEMEPRYVQLAIERWEQMTGRRARLDQPGRDEGGSH